MRHALILGNSGKKSVSKILNEGIRLLLRKIKDRIRNKVCFIEQFVEKMDNYVLIYNILRQKGCSNRLDYNGNTPSNIINE